MPNREILRNKTLEQARLITNQIGVDVGNLDNLDPTFSDKSNIVNVVNSLKNTATKVASASDTTSSSNLNIPFLADTSSATTVKYNSTLQFQSNTNTLKAKNFSINDTAGQIRVPIGTDQTPSIVFNSPGRPDVGFYRVNNSDSVGVGFAGLSPQIKFNADGTISSAGVQTANASELQLTNNTKCLYVSEQELYASDSWTNNGLSLNKPFKSIGRALLEAARQSYVADTASDKNNDRFEYFSIIVFPGNYEIDNRPGKSLSIQNEIDFFDLRTNYGPSGKLATVQTQTAVVSPNTGWYFAGLTNTYTNVSASYVSGSNNGSGATFNVEFTPEETIITVNSLGSGYFENEVLKISGASISSPGATRSDLNIVITSLFDDSEIKIIENLYQLNPPSGGVIVPRGTSIVGLDLRKTVIRPKYVPDPTIPPSGDHRAQDAANLIKSNREYIISEAFGYLEANKTKKSISAITNGAVIGSGPDEPDVFTCVAHGFVENTPIKFLNIPANTTLQANQVYYVDYVTVDTFRIKKSKNSAPLSDVRTSTAVTVGSLQAYSFNVGSQSCKRDIGYFIDALVYDLSRGGNSKLYDTAEFYIDGKNTKLIKGATEIADTLTCLKYATHLAASAVRNHEFKIKGGKNTSNTITLNNATYGITVGMNVSGTGVNTGATITAVTYNVSGAVSSFTVSSANTTSYTNQDYTLSAKQKYNYGFVTPFTQSKFDVYPNFDNSYVSSSGATTECQSTVNSLFTLYTYYEKVLSYPTEYFIPGASNFVQKMYPFGYDRDLESALFRVTGGCYFWQMTFKDGDTSNRPYYVNSSGILTQYSPLIDEPTSSQLSAYKILSENRTTIINDTFTTLQSNVTHGSYATEKCKRDIGYIFDAVSTDLFDGPSANANTYDSVLLYFNAERSALLSNGIDSLAERNAAIFAFDTLKSKMQYYIDDITIDSRINTLVGYLTTALNSQTTSNLPTRVTNSNTGQFPCSHHRLVAFKFANKQELKEYYDKIESIYNANFNPDIPATSTATITTITNDNTNGDLFTTLLNHGFDENTPVKFRPFTNANVPGIDAYKTYYVKYINKSQFRLKRAPSIIPYIGQREADAYNAILANVDIIAKEAYYQYAYAQSPTTTTGVAVPTNSTETDCIDDVRDVIKAIAYNVKYGYNDRAYEAGNIYATGKYVTNNKTATIGILNKARDYAIAAMRNNGTNGVSVFFETRNCTATRSGTTVTVTTQHKHGLASGDSITIAGHGTAALNGTFTVSASGLTTTQFQYTTGTSGTVSNSGSPTYRRSDSAQTIIAVTDDSSASAANKCSSVAEAINSLTAIVTTAITTENMDHVIRSVPPVTPTEDSEDIITTVVSATQSSLSLSVYDANAYSQRVEENRIVGDASQNITIDTVSSASPYIFNCSLRSVYGMSGMHANGEDATGFKSMVLAQYTGISLQRDNRAFTRLNYLNGLPTYKVNAADNRFTKVDSEYIDYWRNYHVKASNDGFLQVVSVFAVGYADHFVSDTGSDISITNSNSNFGNIATLSAGYKQKAFPQDTRGQIVGIIPPKGIDYSRTTAVILDEIDYRTISKWNESRQSIDASKKENYFGKIYIKSTSVNGLFEKDGLPEYTDTDGKKWLLIDGVNYLLGKGKNIAYKTGGDYETSSSETEYIYGSFPIFNGATTQGEFRSRLRERNPNNALDAQTSYDILVVSKTVSYTQGQTSFTVSDSTGIAAGQKIVSELPGIPSNTFVASSYTGGNTIPIVNASGSPVTITQTQSGATVNFYRILSLPENANRMYYGWEWAETSAGVDLGSLVIYVDEFVMYNDVFYHEEYLDEIQSRAASVGQSANFQSQSTAQSYINPSGNTVSPINLSYNDAYDYPYGNLLKRILQRYDSDVNYTLNTTDSLEFEPGASIANAYIKRVSDNRLSRDHIWRFIYRIPKESNAKPPERKYVIQITADDAPSYSKSFYIYDVETVDEYVADTQDGVYYLTVLDANVKNIKNSNDSLPIGYGQNQYFLYPEINLDNPEWNPKEAISVYNNDVKIRTIVLDDKNLSTDNYERVTSYSITGELTKNFVNYITDKNCRETTFSSSALTTSATNSFFENIQSIYSINEYNNIGVNKDVFSGASLSERIIKFKRSCVASPSGTLLNNVTDIEKLVVGADLISISASGGGTVPTLGAKITAINLETRTVTLSASVGVTTSSSYTYTFNSPIAVKIHRPSNIRASGHTWEYVGYGPGNYSTAFPVFQTIVLNRQQIINSQTIERNGGFNGSSGTNSNGDFFIGTQVIDTKGSQSETVNVPKLKTSAQNRLIDPTDLLFITAASSSGTGNLSAFSENLQNTVRTELSDQSSKTVTYDKVTVANLEVGTNIKIKGGIDIANSNMNETDAILRFPKFDPAGKKYGFAKRVDTENINWTANRQTLPEDGFVTARDLGEWAYINRVTGSSQAQQWQTLQDGQFLYAAKTEGVNRLYTFQYGSNFYFNVSPAEINASDFYLKIGKIPSSVITQNLGLSGFIFVDVGGISSQYPVIKGIDPLDVNGGVEWKALKNAWLNPETSENGVTGNFVISYYIHAQDKIIYNVNPFEV
jgi:hypothetical protein